MLKLLIKIEKILLNNINKFFFVSNKRIILLVLYNNVKIKRLG